MQSASGNANADNMSDSDDEVDLDTTINVMNMGPDAQREINKLGKCYHLIKDDFIKYLCRDAEDQEKLRAAKKQEEKKAIFSVSLAYIGFARYICYIYSGYS